MLKTYFNNKKENILFVTSIQQIRQVKVGDNNKMQSENTRLENSSRNAFPLLLSLSNKEFQISSIYRNTEKIVSISFRK